MSGATPRWVGPEELEARALDALPADVGGFFAGGAEDEVTLRANRAALRDVALLPRVLRDVAERSTATTVVGQRLGIPVLAAPIGLMGLAHPDGELAVARATRAAGTVTVLSAVSTKPVEEVVAGVGDGAIVWQQLYLPADPGAAAEHAARAADAGCRALVLTVDAPVLGRRERDLRSGFRVPRGQAAALDPVAPELHSVLSPGLSWRDVDRLRAATRLPLVVKGILHPDDARLAVDHGADAVVVSNHGGRQLDGAPATVAALPAVREAVGDRIEVLVDGGVRRGVDVLRALALGARAVMVGRPLVWGLALGGEAGAARVLDDLRAELDTAMALCGCRTIAEIGPALLARP